MQYGKVYVVKPKKDIFVQGNEFRVLTEEEIQERKRLEKQKQEEKQAKLNKRKEKKKEQQGNYAYICSFHKKTYRYEHFTVTKTIVVKFRPLSK